MKENEAFLMLPICFEFWKQEHHKGIQEEKGTGLRGVGHESPQKPGHWPPSGKKMATALQGDMFLQKHCKVGF